MEILRKLLLPIVPVYYLVTWLRNKFYDLGWKSSKVYDLPVICVGNLSVGGTGKTPMIEFLVDILKQDYRVATLSRGYGRKSKGFQLANASSSAETIGDEPYQFYSKYGKDILVAVDSNRQNGIEKLKAHNPEVILLDDAFQHRKVKAGLNILLSTYFNPYFQDIVLPTGDLREPRSGARRADVIVITKCPEDLKNSQKLEIEKKIELEKHQSLFFSSIAYSELLYASNKTMLVSELEKFTLVTGIANANPLVQFLNSKNLDFEHLNFNDHHDFSEDEIKVLEKKGLIVTTEKDFMRLKNYKALEGKLYYLPISVKIDNQKEFENLVRRFIQ